jgi:hypothetical protein
MYNYFFLFPILFVLFFIVEFDSTILVSGNKFTGYTTKLVEQSFIKNPLTNTSYNQESSNLYLEKKIDNNETQLHKPVVIINTHIFSCIIENVDSGKLCNILYDCNEDLCKNIEAKSNLIVYRKQPIYSVITSNSGTSSNQIKLYPGEYEILFKNNDFRTSSYCNKIVLDGVSFHEFTAGINLLQDSSSIMCINIGDGCYGIIKPGETKICEIGKVLLKNLF